MRGPAKAGHYVRTIGVGPTYVVSAFRRTVEAIVEGVRGKMLMVMSIVVAGAALLAAAQAGRGNGAVLFEGARLITGATGAPIESSAFLVENGRFTKVGRKGDVQAPARRAICSRFSAGI